MASQLRTFWVNTQEMPSLLRIMCQGGMFAGPILLLFVAFPIADWTVNDQQLSYSEFWQSGAGLAATLFISLFTIGCWGVAARKQVFRWALVIAPILPIGVFPQSIISESPSMFVNGLIVSAIIYGSLFYSRSVREYLERP